MATLTFFAEGRDFNITNYVHYAEFTDDIAAIDKLDLLIDKNVNEVGPYVRNGMEVKMKIDGTTHFNGYVEKYDEKVNFNCKCISNASILARRQANDLYDTQTISDIVTDLITKYTDFGTSNIKSTTVTLTQFKATDTVFDAIEKLAAVLNWQWYVTPDDEFHFEPKNYTASGVDLEVGVNCYKVGKWTYDTSKMVNHLIIEGGRREAQYFEEFSGDGSTTTFTLTYKPIGGFRVLVGGTEKILGVAGTTSTYDYTADLENGTITFETAPGSGSDNIDVYYNYTIPIKVEGSNQTSIDLYGRYEHKIIDRNLDSRTDAKNALQKILDDYSTPFTKATLETTEINTNLRAGHTTTVTDSTHGITGEVYTIKEVRIYYGKGKGQRAQIIVGDRDYRLYDWEKDLDRRIKELERLLKTDEELVTKLYQFVDPIDYNDTNTGDLVVKTRGIGSTFILGHDLNGTLGSPAGGQLGWQGDASWTTHYTSP